MAAPARQHDDDEPAKDTPFYKALPWRVHCPDEAQHIAAVCLRHAARLDAAATARTAGDAS